MESSSSKLVELAHALVPEHLDHAAHFFARVNLGMAGAEDHVPEQRHLLFQLVFGVYHAIHPVLDVDLDGPSVIVGRVVAQHQVVFDPGIGLRAEHLLNHRVITFRSIGFNLVAAGVEAGSA